jgi:hypothetical protein
MGLILIIIGIALLLRPRHYFGCGLFGPMFYHRSHHRDFHDHCGPMRGPHGHGGMHGPMF